LSFVAELAALIRPVIVSERPFEGPGGQLYRRSFQPEGNLVARLALIHGYGDHSGRYAHFMRWMAERGIACDAVDLRGQGMSAGRRGHVVRWDAYLDDLRAFLDATMEGDRAVPRFVLGHSHGGMVVAIAGEMGLLESAGMRACILTAPYFRSRMIVPRWKVLFGRAVGAFVPWLPMATGLANEWMSSDAQMIADSKADPLCTHVATPRWYLGQLEAQRRVLDHASDFRLPLLVLAAGADPIADNTATEEFVRRAAASDKIFRTCPGLLHEILRERGREAIFAEILEWLSVRARANRQGAT
jgi:alpha-beta hydrolase superfamily lysophospholipase